MQGSARNSSGLRAHRRGGPGLSGGSGSSDTGSGDTGSGGRQGLGSARQRNRQWTLHAGCQGTGERHKGGSRQGCGSGGAQGLAAAGARALDVGHWSSEQMCMMWYESEQGPLFIELLGS